MKTCIDNANIVTPKEIVNGSLYIKNGKIEKIVKAIDSYIENEYQKRDALGN